MFKLGLLVPFEYSKYKLWVKEGLGVKLSIWLSTIKSLKLPWFTCVQVVCHISLESSWQELQLALDLISIEGLKKTHELLKLQKSQFREFWDSQLVSHETKLHLDVTPMTNHREYHKGEGGGFPQV